jgi:hypothetical protein
VDVLCPDGRLIRDARVFATSHRLDVWRRKEIHGVELALSVDLSEPFSVDANRGTLQGALEVRTADGVFYVNRGAGCGCHSPLILLSAPVGWTG